MTNHGFLKVATAVPLISLGNPSYNAQQILVHWRQAEEQGAACIVFPELSLTGATCGDLFLYESLQEQCLQALAMLVKESKTMRCAALVGLPFFAFGQLYNVSILLAQGHLLCATPKEPDAQQARWFAKYDAAPAHVTCLEQSMVFGQAIVPLAGATLGVVFAAEDLLAVSKRGANILLLQTASPARVDRHRQFVQFLCYTAKLAPCAIVVAGAGVHESSGDGVYAGDCLLVDRGELLVCADRYQSAGHMQAMDVDLGGLLFARQTQRDMQMQEINPTIFEQIMPPVYQIDKHFARKMSAHPFYQDDPAFFAEAFQIQVAALKRRMTHIGTQKIVLAWSAGLDSTSALLVALQALKELGYPAHHLVAVSMPGLATSSRTRDNAKNLATLVGGDFREIDIATMCNAELLAIGHDGVTPDITYENVQARRRMQIAMDLANMLGALQLSTGDMSELALGWCTYGGDQIGMYGVNGGIPKTMLQKMIAYHADNTTNQQLRDTLLAILATPISPELTPGAEMQSTEGILGPYALHDFFLYHHLVSGAGYDKLLFMAVHTFSDRYQESLILKTLDIFCKRYHASQYKRTTAPEGPSVLQVSLSPRSGLIMPSDSKASM